MTEANATATTEQTFTKPANGTWCHIELPTTDVEAQKSFWGTVFGWNFQDIPEMNYTMYTTGEGTIGGGFWTENDETPEAIKGKPLNYVWADDIEATLETIEANGGTTINPKTEVGTWGWMALATDVSGNVFGLWTGNPDACH